MCNRSYSSGLSAPGLTLTPLYFKPQLKTKRNCKIIEKHICQSICMDNVAKVNLKVQCEDLEGQKRIIPQNWRDTVQINDDIDATSDGKKWYAAKVILIKKMNIVTKNGKKEEMEGFKVHFKNRHSKYDLWFAKNSQNLALPGTNGIKCTVWRANLKNWG